MADTNGLYSSTLSFGLRKERIVRPAQDCGFDSKKCSRRAPEPSLLFSASTTALMFMRPLARPTVEA